MIDKVIAYITRGRQLLVFSEPDFPEAGVQVPGGTIEAGESPEQAVLREAREETGLRRVEIVRFLGTNLYHAPDRRTLRRYYFHLTCLETPAGEWDHWEPSPEGGEQPVRFRLRWVHLAEVPPLAGGRGAFLAKLTERYLPTG